MCSRGQLLRQNFIVTRGMNEKLYGTIHQTLYLCVSAYSNMSEREYIKEASQKVFMLMILKDCHTCNQTMYGKRSFFWYYMYFSQSQINNFETKKG